MPTRPQIYQLCIAHALVAVGLLAARVAFGSGDPSGLQYLFLIVGTVPIVIAALVLAVGRAMKAYTPLTGIALIGAALLDCVFPYTFGIGLDGRRIDTVGYWAATAILVAQVALLAASAARWRRLGT